MAAIITFGSYKGGAGKTTLAASFCAWAQNVRGKRVVGIDCDPQAHLAKWAAKRKISSRHSDVPIRPIEVIHLEDSPEINTEAADVQDRNALVEAINTIDAADPESVVVIDCPGSLSNFVTHAHALADIVVTPADVTSPTMLADLTEDYAGSIPIWRRRCADFEKPAFEWRVVPNKVPHLSDRGVIPPYHYGNMEELRRHQKDLGFAVTPVLPFELAYAPAMEQGMSIFDPVSSDWLREAVGSFDKAPG